MVVVMMSRVRVRGEVGGHAGTLRDEGLLGEEPGIRQAAVVRCH